ncbi:cyclic AMP-responsive element-binding protein 3-like protein 3 isoform X2 [Aquarana catesbeiana]|uniref:cyclic AMP-responsive element-binding protein 3-like protein 3 isoform X2 n=1 Tax=Aquarana catesbeiana TaxID=8400 RepID=UPI003CCA24FF
MSIPDARYIRGRTLRLASSNVNLYDSLIHMEVEKRQELSEYNQGGMQSLELLDLLFDCQDGILRHEYSPAESIWAASGTNISTQENEAFVSPLLLPADSPLDSNLWSPAASDSGISEDAHSDHQNSPFQYQFVDACYVTSNLRDFPEQDLCMNLGGHADIWTGLICNGNNPKSQPQISDIPLTVKDLLLSSSFDMQASTLPQNGHNTGTCGELVLTEDERKLLSKEGVVLPTQLPLTKHEERVLKRIRRKIRNKQSAQESRKKKKEYMDGLEMRMSACAAQNQELQRKVLQLEKHNMSLLEQLRKLQALVSHSAGKATQTSTCVAFQQPSTPQEWQTVASHFAQRWDFPNCRGAIDRKHVHIVPPPNSGSYYYNYKGFNSIVMLAVVSANYDFLYVDVGKNGRMSDGGVIAQTEFYRRKTEAGILHETTLTALESGRLGLPSLSAHDVWLRYFEFFAGRGPINMPDNL